MKARWALRLSLLPLACLVVLALALLQARQSVAVPGSTTSSAHQSNLQGTDLGGTPAPDFRLTDQFGKQVLLSQFRGKPVVLTFLFTHCPNVCPLTAEKLHATMLDLGSDAQRVAVLAVTTDPKRDTLASALAFSKVHHMEDYWHFLIGPHDAVAPIWSSYGVYAEPGSTYSTTTHSLAVYVIDKQGRERVFLNNDFTSAELKADLEVLLHE